MKLIVGMPVYSGIHPKVVQNLIKFDLENQKNQNSLSFHFPQTSIISHSRNLIMRDALKQNADWLLFWDSDVEILDKEFLPKLFKIAYRNNVPVIGIPVRLKGKNAPLNCGTKDKLGYINWQELTTDNTRVDVCGTGVLMINLEWIRKNWNKAPWFHVMDTETGFFPEDWWFCEEVRKHGGKIMVDPTIKTIHYGTYGYKS